MSFELHKNNFDTIGVTETGITKQLLLLNNLNLLL